MFPFVVWSYFGVVYMGFDKDGGAQGRRFKSKAEDSTTHLPCCFKGPWGFDKICMQCEAEVDDMLC